MSFRFHRFLLPILLSAMAAGCATTPQPVEKSQPSSVRAPVEITPHIATAKRFLHSWGAGEVVMAGFRKEMESQAAQEPGVAELVRRAFADVTADQMETMVARIYARHLSQRHLASLAEFTESPTGNRFFRSAVTDALEGRTSSGRDMMRQYTADQLTEILKFTQSEAFTALQQALPTINRELAEEGRRFGADMMREYISRQ